MSTFYNKSQVAFIMSVENMFEKFKTCYFWTFTFTKVMPDWYYPRSWHLFMHDLNNQYGGFVQGVRVLEVGAQGHGLHYHAVLNRRISVHLVRRLGRKVGMGRVQVETCTPDAARYLAKYLVKENPLWPGMRRWGSVGGYRTVKTCNIEVDSIFHRNLKILTGGKKVEFGVVNEIMRQSRLYGEYSEWPSAKKANLPIDNEAVLCAQFRCESPNVTAGASAQSGGKRRVYVLDRNKSYAA